MKSFEIREAIKNNIPLVWNDPDPIDDTDYTITRFNTIWREEAIIEYNNGHSMAEVYLSEISIKK